jgi:hypothetical protein
MAAVEHGAAYRMPRFRKELSISHLRVSLDHNESYFCKNTKYGTCHKSHLTYLCTAIIATPAAARRGGGLRFRSQRRCRAHGICRNPHRSILARAQSRLQHAQE